MTMSMMFVMTLVSVMFIMMMSLSFNGTLPNKQTPFECGIEPMMEETMFSMKFFMLTLMFMLFDIEMIILIPMPFTSMSSTLYFTLMFTPFMMSLMMSVLYEIKEGGLSWNE